MGGVQKHLVGIDLGTTYSSLSWLDERSRPHSIPNSHGEALTPSIVFFPHDGAPPIVGEDAIKPGCDYPERFVEQAKRYMGADGKVWRIDGVLYTPVDISAIIISQLLADAQPRLGTITEAVVTVPAHFTGYQRKLTIEAGQQAGLKKVSIVNEPVAAAIAYVLRDRIVGDAAEAFSMIDDDDEYDSTVLVYDLGGGTFDLSIVRHSHRELRVLAASGEEKLGGIDWDDRLLEVVSDQMKAVCGDIRTDARALRRARFEIEAAKRRLSAASETTLKLQYKGEEREFTVTREEFERRSHDLVERTRQLTEELLASCKLTWNDLDFMLPVGGATLMPMIQRTILGFAAQLKSSLQDTGTFIRHVSPHVSIANGAALFAAVINAQSHLNGISNIAANDIGVILTDSDGQRHMHSLIQRSEPLPKSVNVTLATKEANQRRASIRVVEGRGKLTEAKVLCKCTIADLPPNLPQHSLIDVTLSYDIDGLLHLIAKHRDTGRLATVSALYGSV